MHIYFQIGSPTLGSVNTINFGKIHNQTQFERLKSLIQTSGLQISSGLEALFSVEKPNNSTQLTIYLKDAYGSFSYVFKSDSYLILKARLSTEFPELTEQFPCVEKHTQNEEELQAGLEELQDYQRYGFFDSAAHIEKLETRLAALRHNLDSDDTQKFRTC